ncbi:MAG: flagellar basal body rod protein FlgB [Magnetococcales bacterium]|nr:flagellar basal body rod protein FlgB [Magnetococcales bacterium]MBF0434300.1 flagellar basal body rod protein FlgB [Magnetococcales bacterium]
MAGLGLLGPAGAFKTNLLNLRQQRQELIAANIANVDTPGYKSMRLEFEDEMAKAMPPPGSMAMTRTSGKHMPVPYEGPVAGELQAVEIPIPRGDLNSVDMEQEMAMQSANQLLYNYAVQSLSSQISSVRMAIAGQ